MDGRALGGNGCALTQPNSATQWKGTYILYVCVSPINYSSLNDMSVQHSNSHCSPVWMRTGHMSITNAVYTAGSAGWQYMAPS